MHRRLLSLALTGFICIVIINWSCTKLDTTTLGSDLIPAVDNVNTFADTFYINATQHDYTDSTLVLQSEDHALGKITNDPLFGQTDARIYLQLKPSSFPFAFGQKDSIAGGLDSVVLCLNYKGFWGDSSIIQTLQINEITDPVFRDSVNTDWPITYKPTGIGGQVGQKQVYIPDLSNYMVYNNKIDSENNQIRIKLDPVFANRLFGSDSASSGTGNHAFYNDSIFRSNFIGLAVTSIANGNALMYINLADTNTKLEVHYRIKNLGRTDTVYKSLILSTSTTADVSGHVTKNPSPTANYISRNRAGMPASNPGPGELYLQGQPGTYAALSIPKLTGYSNRIIHRAEIIMDQIPDAASDAIFVPPNYMYLDLQDSATTSPPKYKPLYYDLNAAIAYDPDNIVPPFYPTGGPDFGYFGAFVRRKPGPFGAIISYYNINVTRYIQHMVINQSRNYALRIWPAFSFRYAQYSTGYFAYNNSIGLGRVRLGTGDNPNYRMRIRIIYSPIK